MEYNVLVSPYLPHPPMSILMLPLTAIFLLSGEVSALCSGAELSTCDGGYSDHKTVLALKIVCCPPFTAWRCSCEFSFIEHDTKMAVPYTLWYFWMVHWGQSFHLDCSHNAGPKHRGH